jgi:DNA transformation protein and related proteins
MEFIRFDLRTEKKPSNPENPTKGRMRDSGEIWIQVRCSSLLYEQIMQAADEFEVKARRMFGGMGIYTGERMFAFLVGEDVAFKLAQADFDAAMQMPGAGPMRPEPESEPLREYVTMPRAVLDDSEQFLHWLQKSAEYVRSRAARSA